jgi:hypothetical protein
LFQGDLNYQGPFYALLKWETLSQALVEEKVVMEHDSDNRDDLRQTARQVVFKNLMSRPEIAITAQPVKDWFPKLARCELPKVMGSEYSVVIVACLTYVEDGFSPSGGGSGLGTGSSNVGHGVCA